MSRIWTFLSIVMLLSVSVGCTSSETTTVESIEIATPSQAPSTNTPIPVSPTPSLPRTPTTEPAAIVEEITSLEIFPVWEVGDGKTVEIVKTKIEAGRGVEDSSISSRTIIDITVIDKTDEYYVIEWEYGETTFDNEEAANNPLVAMVLGLTMGMRLEYETDQFGSFIRLRNWEEVQQNMQMVFEALIQTLQEYGFDEDMITLVRDTVEPMVSGEQAISQTLKEVHLYHLPFGLNYEIDKPITYSDLLPNPFGGDSFPSEGVLLLESYDSEVDEAVVSWKQTLDPVKAKEILLQTLSDIAVSMGGSPISESELPEPFSILDSCDYVIDSATMWIIDLTCQREAVIGEQSQTEITAITIIQH